MELREQARELNWDGVNFPTPLKGKDIENFERSNGRPVVIIDWDRKNFIPLCQPTRGIEGEPVTLFYMKKEGKGHYGCVKDFGKALGMGQSSDHAKSFICPYCLCNQHSKDRLDEHVEHCSKKESALVKMPKPGSVRKFGNDKNTVRYPFVIYCDYETYHKEVNGTRGNAEVKFVQVPFTFTIVPVSTLPEFQLEPITYCGEDAEKVFVNELEKIRDAFHKKFARKRKMVFGEKEQEHYFAQKEIYNCKKEFGVGVRKVRDHSLFTGEYRGALCNRCNIRLKRTWRIPVYAHNMSNFDSHVFTLELNGRGDDTDVTAIPNDSEKYVLSTLTKKVELGERTTPTGKIVPVTRELQLVFQDTMRHAPGKLDTLVRNLRDDQLVQLRKVFPKEEEFQLLKRKGIYPYEHMGRLDRINETKLPPIGAFDTTLGSGVVYECDKEDVSEIEAVQIRQEDYDHAKKVFEVMKCKDLGDYTKLYCLVDTLLLADVFEAYREEGRGAYGLDPAYYATSPSLSIDDMLRMTKAEIELISDPEMYAICERGIRGGISVVCERLVEANNKYMDNFDPSLPLIFAQYLDVNSLYSKAQTFPLPVGGFRMLQEKELRAMEEDYSLIKSCILEVDLDVPSTKAYHDWVRDYPLAAEPKEVLGTVKLVPNLLNKREMVFHQVELNSCLKYGLILKKVHRRFTFVEKDVVRDYIELNNKFRTEATTKFGKDFFKLMNNSCFGKFLENLRKRCDIVIVDESSARG